MWIFTRSGFFSVTRSIDDPSQMQIRARVRTDLENLCANFGLGARILDTPAADYRYRVIVPPETVVNLFTMLAQTIDYSNFKQAVHDTPGQEDKAGPYMRVWATMAALQPTPPHSRDPDQFRFLEHDEPGELGAYSDPAGLPTRMDHEQAIALFDLAMNDRFTNPKATEPAADKTAKRTAAIAKAKAITRKKGGK